MYSQNGKLQLRNEETFSGHKYIALNCGNVEENQKRFLSLVYNSSYVPELLS